MKLISAALLLFCFVPCLVSAEVTLTTDRTQYAPGEIVEFTLFNGSDEALMIVHEPPYCVFWVDRDEGVFCGNLPGVVFVDPEESWIGRWDTDWRPDPPGIYEIVVNWHYESEWELEEWPSYQLRARYTVGSPLPSAHDSWSALKSRF